MKINELWDELKFELGGTRLNKLDGIKEKKILLGSGNREADLLFIGDDADLYEDEELGFDIGSSGEFLMQLCDFADISPEKYYITTLSKCALRWRELSDVERDHMKDYLNMQIALIKPKVIVPLGQEVTNILLEKELKIVAARGKVHPWQGNIKIVPTYEPSYVKRTRDQGGKKAKPAVEFWNDLKMIKGELEG